MVIVWQQIWVHANYGQEKTYITLNYPLLSIININNVSQVTRESMLLNLQEQNLPMNFMSIEFYVKQTLLPWILIRVTHLTPVSNSDTSWTFFKHLAKYIPRFKVSPVSSWFRWVQVWKWHKYLPSCMYQRLSWKMCQNIDCVKVS